MTTLGSTTSQTSEQGRASARTASPAPSEGGAATGRAPALSGGGGGATAVAESPVVERVAIEEASSEEIWLHTHRYRFAVPLVRGKRVLDIACGEGYGSRSLMESGAASVVGVDICEKAVKVAREKYNVNAMVGTCTAIPLPDQSVDVVISFETIEHILEQEEFLREIHRVLAPGGTLAMSTPNHQVWHERGHHNPFHLKELYEREFVDLLSRQFKQVRLFTQGCVTAGPWSLRYFAAPRSRWRKIAATFLRMDHPFRWLPGYWRFRDTLSQYARGGWDNSIPADFRGDPMKLVLRTTTTFADRLSHYRVRPRRKLSGEVFEYMVALARKP